MDVCGAGAGQLCVWYVMVQLTCGGFVWCGDGADVRWICVVLVMVLIAAGLCGAGAGQSV